MIAVLGYCAVYREVKPKQDKVEALEKEYSEAVNYLDSLNREINRLQSTLDGLNARYDTAMMRKQELQEETDLMMRRLVAADKLMSGNISKILWRKFIYANHWSSHYIKTAVLDSDSR